MKDQCIKKASLKDVDALAALERACFPVAEAASKEAIEERVKYYGNHFWCLWQADTLLSFVDGFVTNERDLTDEMYEKASMHQEDGDWQMIFGLNTHPDHRRQGYAGLLLREVIKDAKAQRRKGVVLTCKEALIPYYASFGFENEGISASVHGNVVWYQMRILLENEKHSMV